jgi:hypothetical protein
MAGSQRSDYDSTGGGALLLKSAGWGSFASEVPNQQQCRGRGKDQAGALTD